MDEPYSDKLQSEQIPMPRDPSYHWEGSQDYPPQFVLQSGFIRCSTSDKLKFSQPQPASPTARGIGLSGGGITSLFKKTNKPPPKSKIVFARWIISDLVCLSPRKSVPAEQEVSENIIADVLEYRDGSGKRVQICIRSSPAGALQIQILPRPEDPRRHGKNTCACHTRIEFWADVSGAGGMWSGVAPFDEVRYLKASVFVEGQREVRWMDRVFSESRDCSESEWTVLKEKFGMKWCVPEAPESGWLAEWKNKKAR